MKVLEFILRISGDLRSDIHTNAPSNYVIEIRAEILKSCIKSGRLEILYKIFSTDSSCGPLAL